MSEQTPSYDIVIIGGGMVGASLACALGDTPLRVAVVEGVPLRSDTQPSYDDRSIALAYGSRRIFEGIGVWSALAEVVAPIRRIHVSDRGRFGATRLSGADQGVDALGYVVETRELGRVLAERLASLSNVELLCPAQLREFECGHDVVSVAVDTPEGARQLSAKLLVAADGTHSTVRERLGIEVKRWDYGQTAVISNVSAELDHQGVAYERFTDGGPLALLPLPPHQGDVGRSRCSLVWTVRGEQVDWAMGLSDEDFLAEIQSRFGHRLGRLLRVGERRAYPLSLLRVSEHVRPRAALIGNAAHALHPVAGQGFNLGIRDVAVLAELLAEAAASGQDPGDMTLLNRYAEWRRRDHRVVMAFTDGLARIFSNPLPPVALARDAGLVALDMLPPLKAVLTRQTMGLAGRLPRLGLGLPLHRDEP